ncbi:MAG: hypothetical protein SNJ63_02890 [Sphingomonadaceae bacterium]
MLFSLVYLLLVLLLVLALNRGFFTQLGLGRTVQLLLVWGCIFAGGVVLVRLLGIS